MLETTPIPWAQGVARSNPAAPTNGFRYFQTSSLWKNSAPAYSAGALPIHVGALSVCCLSDCARTVPELLFSR